MVADALTIPAYRRIAAELRESLLVAGDDMRRLPTERELCASHGVSRQTARRAYQELEAEGLIERVRGRGTFGAAPSRYLRSLGTIEDLMALSDDTEMEIIEPLRLTAGSPRARADLGVGQLMEVCVRRLRGGEPFCATIISLPISVGQQLRSRFLEERGARRQTTIIQMIERDLHHHIRDARQEISVDVTPSNVARLIELAEGAPALRIDRLYRDEEGNPIESTVNFFNPARYSYRIEIRRAGPKP